MQEQQQQAVEKLRTQLATADLKVRKAGLDVQSLTQQLQKSQDELQVRPALDAKQPCVYCECESDSMYSWLCCCAWLLLGQPGWGDRMKCDCCCDVGIM